MQAKKLTPCVAPGDHTSIIYIRRKNSVPLKCPNVSSAEQTAIT